jgi:lipoprotein-anchoring transpeptidase ErfK/SrfK
MTRSQTAHISLSLLFSAKTSLDAALPYVFAYDARQTMKTAEAIRTIEAKAKVLIGTVVLLAAEAAHAADPASIQQQTPTASRTELIPARVIVVSIPDRKLALIENGEVKKVFSVAVGKPSTPSPTGSFKVVNRVVNPTYYHQGKVIASGAANPLGARWMGLSEHGYGIHGTNVPNSIGKAASHGCIRMAKADLEQLFNLVQVGDAVEIRAERDELTARLFGTADNTLLAAATTQTATVGQ